MDNQALRAAAYDLLSKIEQLVVVINLGWAGAPGPHPLLYPLHKYTTANPQASKVHLCMPLCADQIKNTPYVSQHNQGYGVLNFGKGLVNGKSKVILLGVHKVVCWLFHGMPPSQAHQVGHKCGFTNCINAHHLCYVTRSLNRRMEKWHRVNGRGNVCPYT